MTPTTAAERFRAYCETLDIFVPWIDEGDGYLAITAPEALRRTLIEARREAAQQERERLEIIADAIIAALRGER